MSSSRPKYFKPSLVLRRSKRESVRWLPYIRDQEVLQDLNKGIANAQTDNDLNKPTAVEYTQEIAKGFLDVLDSVAQQIPIPGIGLAVRLAMNIIKACEDGHATLEKAEELAQDVMLLVSAVVNELKGKKPEEIKENFRQDIENLQSDLQYIEVKLGEIMSQGRIRLVLFSSLNEEKVEKCMRRLDRLLQRFSVMRDIRHASHLQHLENEIRSFHDTQREILEAQSKALDRVQSTLNNMSTKMDTIGTMMTNVSSSPPFSTRAAIPANTELFYGRDELVIEVAAHLTATVDSHRQRHTCILGPGGMGKTATALAVMGHPDVKKLYSDRNLVWVPSVQATSIPLFFDTLALSLGITDMKGNINDVILSVLKSAEPLILLLDNFETPWNIDGGRSIVEQMLRDINRIPHITLFVTMRSSAPPCRGIHWNSVNLKALRTDAARQIYSDICPGSTTDPDVVELLELIGHMPLAVTLMATSASLSGLSAKDLIEQYNKIGPTMLGQGSDSENSMDICISLSVDSLPMKRHPESRWLLGVLSMLPVGTTFNMLDKWWARGLPNMLGALQVLQETSLVERQGTTFVVLPVIQRYILDPSRFDLDIRTSMIASACNFLVQHNSEPGGELYKEHKAALSADEGNLEAVLLQVVASSEDMIRALVVLAWHHHHTRPRTNAIEHALKLVSQMKSNHSLHADVLWCYAHICYPLNRLEESRKHYMGARKLFIFEHRIGKAAECLLQCVNIDRLEESTTLEAIRSAITDAQTEFKSIGDEAGIARCWLHLGTATLWRSHDYSSALGLLHRARDKYAQLELPLLFSTCLYHIARCYFLLGDFEQAEASANSAQHEFTRLGDASWVMNVTWLLGCIYTAQGQNHAAIALLVPYLAWSRVSGGPMHIGWALETMGIARMQLNDTSGARRTFQEALEVFQHVSETSHCSRCWYFVRKMDDPRAVPTLQERAAFVKYYPQSMLDGFEIKKDSEGPC